VAALVGAKALDASKAIVLDTREYDATSQLVKMGANSGLSKEYLNALNDRSRFGNTDRGLE
jgi:hypothetical protein